MIRADLALFAVALGTAACGTQFADPIADHQGDAACPTGHALQFDGTSYGTMTRLIQDDFTIECWIKTSTMGKGPAFSDGNAIAFADVETVQVNDFATSIVYDKFVVSIGGPDTAATSTSSVTTDQWVHVAATRARGTGVALVFINGVLEASTAGNKNSLGESPDLSLGGRSGRNFYTGLMSEVRLWRTVRTEHEIMANLHHRMNGSEAGLVGYYRLDESSDTIAHDASPSGNDATLTGPARWISTTLPFCD